MAITIELPDGQRIQIERTSITVGRGPGVDVVIPSPDLQPVHARITKVAGRWMVESAGDWLLQVGDGVPGRKHWLQPDQVIRLTESGVRIVFEPAGSTPLSQPKARDAVPVSTAKGKVASSSRSGISPPRPSQPKPPPLPPGFGQTAEPVTPPWPPNQVDPRDPPVSAVEHSASQPWYYLKSGHQECLCFRKQLRQLAASGQLEPSDLVWQQGMGQWVEARERKELFPECVLPPTLPSGTATEFTPTDFIAPSANRGESVTARRNAHSSHNSWWQLAGVVVLVLMMIGYFNRGTVTTTPKKSFKNVGEIALALRGKNQQDVVSFLGKPDFVNVGGTLVGGADDEDWLYHDLVKHPVTGTPQTVQVHFLHEIVVQVNVQ